MYQENRIFEMEFRAFNALNLISNTNLHYSFRLKDKEFLQSHEILNYLRVFSYFLI